MQKSIKTLGLSFAAAAAFALAGCFSDSNPASETNGAKSTLVLSLGVKDVNDLAKGLAKGQTIELRKLVIELKSSVATDSVILDTLEADSGSGFVSNSKIQQTVLVSYSILPLRNWTVIAHTVDSRGVVIHSDTAEANNIGIGEVRPVQLNLQSKYVVYAAKFTLPDSIASASGDQKQKLYVRRLRMTVDGITVRDTTLVYFAADSTHLVEFDYVRADTAHTIGLYVYADSLGSWDPNFPVYGDTIHITSTDTTYTPKLPWTGPGSSNPSDPNYTPGSGAYADLKIIIGAVGLVTLETGVEEIPLPKVLRKKN